MAGDLVEGLDSMFGIHRLPKRDFSTLVIGEIKQNKTMHAEHAIGLIKTEAVLARASGLSRYIVSVFHSPSR